MKGPERPGFGVKGQVTTFVGRRQELALLEARFVASREGIGQIVGVSGEPGIGKSRLMSEFCGGDSGDLSAAEGHFRDALALADELGMRPLLARCHLGLATLYRRMGRPESSTHHGVTARAMFRAMDMTRWLERADAELTAN